jgi:hypothetical protein
VRERGREGEGVSARDGEVGNRERKRQTERHKHTFEREKTESTGGGGEVEEGGSLQQQNTLVL